MTHTSITPTLFLGPPETAQGREDMLPVETVEDAYTAIMSGHKALLPPESWALAADVLQRLGASERLIASRLKTAGFRA